MIADDLAGEAHAAHSFRGQHVAFGDGHPIGLAFDEFDTAGRAARVAAAGMQDVDPRILFDREHQPLACFYLDTGKSFNGQLWHRVSIIRLELIFWRWHVVDD